MPSIILASWLLLSSIPGAPGTPMVGFEQDSYTLAWADVRANVVTNEYVRAHESVENWNRMLTFKEYAGSKKISDVLPGYMASIKAMIAQKPKVFEKEESRHAEEVIVALTLLAPDKSHYEYVVHRLVADQGKPVKSMIFSLRIPYSENVDFAEIDKKTDQWMAALEEVNPELYKTVPIAKNHRTSKRNGKPSAPP